MMRDCWRRCAAMGTVTLPTSRLTNRAIDLVPPPTLQNRAYGEDSDEEDLREEYTVKDASVFYRIEWIGWNGLLSVSRSFRREAFSITDDADEGDAGCGQIY